jgi:hypothetical protein
LPMVVSKPRLGLDAMPKRSPLLQSP